MQNGQTTPRRGLPEAVCVYCEWCGLSVTKRKKNRNPSKRISSIK